MQVHIFSLHCKCNTFLLFKFEWEKNHSKHIKIVYKLQWGWGNKSFWQNYVHKLNTSNKCNKFFWGGGSIEFTISSSDTTLSSCHPTVLIHLNSKFNLIDQSLIYFN